MAEQEFTIEELQNEEWRPVVGYEGYYSVSNLGRVRRDKTAKGTFVGRILKTRNDHYGYPYLALCKNGIPKKTFKVHILVARTFLGACPKGYEVNHINQPKTNSRLANLEYLTHRENIMHSIATGLRRKKVTD